MQIVAYYRTHATGIIRRIIGPMSVLAQRGHQTFFSQLESIQTLDSVTADIVLLPNWAYHGRLPAIQGVYVYDLTESSFLDDPLVVNVLEQCAGAFAATDAIARRAKAYCPTAMVMPSFVYRDWLHSAHAERKLGQFIGCFGSFDWSEIYEPLGVFLAACPQVKILTESLQLAEQFPTRVALVVPEPAAYIQAIRSCFFGVVPGHDRTVDPGIIFEYGISAIPTVVGPAWAPEVGRGAGGKIANTKEQWAAALIEMATAGTQRTSHAAAAQELARKQTVVRNADVWLRGIGKFCPTMTGIRTLG